MWSNLQDRMYSGSLNVSSGGAPLRRRKTQRARRTSHVLSDAELTGDITAFTSVWAFARRIFYYIRKIIFGISEDYGEFLNNLLD